MQYSKMKIMIKRGRKKASVSPVGSSPWREEVVGSAEGINSIFYAFGSIPGYPAGAFARKSHYMYIDDCIVRGTGISDRIFLNP